MDKGKKPIDHQQQEEDFLSLDEDYYYDPNMILSPAALASPEFSVIFSEGSGSGKEPTLVDEMEAAKEDFFTKFLNMNFADQSSPKMNVQDSMLPISKAADLKISGAVNKPPSPPVAPETYTMPQQAPLQASEANGKPIVFRKTMPPHVLAEVALYDPKRAKRIVTNRLSAVRAKEKKKLYMFMLEHKLHSLQSKSTKLTARLTLLQTESKSLNAENNILRDRMDVMSQQLHLQDSLNDQIRNEIQHMRNALVRVISNFVTSAGFAGSGNCGMTATLATAAAAEQLEQLRLQNPYQQGDFQQHRYLGLCNFGGEYENGECSQVQQQNPEPYDHDQYQVEDEGPQPPESEATHDEDYSADDSQP